ncbi:MAG: nucleotidyltransferase domain-containing protein [Phycisphaerae bacterium]|jgi:predicted nucleotidyltransferase
MLSSQVRQIVKSCAEQYGVERVWLFGSAVKDEKHAKDFDFAVEGLSPEKFFDFYGRLFFDLPKPVDLIDLSQNLPIASLIRRDGVCIYERRS